MISSEELSSALRGAWRLLNRDLGGINDFDLSVDGFKNSFTAILLVAPIYLFIVGATHEILPPRNPAEGVPYIQEGIALLVEWALFVGGVLYATRLLGLARRAVPYLIAYNWSSLLIVSAMVPPTLLARYGVIGGGGFVVLSLVVTVGALYYRWFLARAVLGATATIATIFMVADIAINLIVQSLIR